MHTEILNDGKTYKVTESGTYYNIETPDKVIECIEKCLYNGRRVRLFYGDIKTGENWNELYDISGTIGRSTGKHIPILLHNTRSNGGGAILTHCIIAIKEPGKNGCYLYRAENFTPPVAEIVESDLKGEGYTHNVNVNGQLQTRHKTFAAAQRMASRFMY
jgi:hypothetical protein